MVSAFGIDSSLPGLHSPTGGHAVEGSAGHHVVTSGGTSFRLADSSHATDRPAILPLITRMSVSGIAAPARSPSRARPRRRIARRWISGPKLALLERCRAAPQLRQRDDLLLPALEPRVLLLKHLIEV